MELKFEELPYQLDAVNAVANLFAGQPNHARTFDLTSQGTGAVCRQRLGFGLGNARPESEHGAKAKRTA